MYFPWLTLIKPKNYKIFGIILLLFPHNEFFLLLEACKHFIKINEQCPFTRSEKYFLSSFTCIHGLILQSLRVCTFLMVNHIVLFLLTQVSH